MPCDGDYYWDMGSAPAQLNWQNVMEDSCGYVYICMCWKLEWYSMDLIGQDSSPPLVENHSLLLGHKEFWFQSSLLMLWYSVTIIFLTDRLSVGLYFTWCFNICSCLIQQCVYLWPTVFSGFVYACRFFYDCIAMDQ